MEYPTYVRNILAVPTDKYGQIRILNLQPGDYTLAKGVSTVAAAEPAEVQLAVDVVPNPARDFITVSADMVFEEITLVDSRGSTVRTWTFQEPTREVKLQTGDLPAGAYWLIVNGEKSVGAVALQKW
jgi:hypothetical protein